MKQRRKTTFEGRIEIVTFTMVHNKNYHAAVEKYGGSYQQVYSWVRKFKKDGINGLLDRRGKGLESKLISVVIVAIEKATLFCTKFIKCFY